jgi:5-methylcytosine-specific restriction protein A
MPPIPKKTICVVCGRVTSNTDRYCDEHKREKKTPESVALYDKRRGSPSKRGYNNDWVKFRKFYLREHPLCVQCEKEGRITPASEIHHIKTLRDGGDKYGESNLMPLCHSCHSKITIRESVHRRTADAIP